MGCFSCEEAPEEPKQKQRHCTDPFWLVLFAICWVILLAGSLWSLSAGNVTRLILGYDSFGNICGLKNKPIEGINWSGMDMRENPFVFHMNPNDISKSLKICVKKCADTNITMETGLTDFYSRTGSFLYRYDLDLDPNTRVSHFKNVNPRDILTFREIDEKHGFGPLPILPVMPQRPLLHRCVPVGRLKLGNSFVNNIYSYLKNGDVPQKILSDINASSKKIAHTVLLGVGVAILVTFTIHFFASLVSTVLMIVSSLVLIGATLFSWYVYFDLRYKLNRLPLIEQLDDDLVNENTFLIFSILLTIISLVIITFTIIMRGRVALMVALFSETGACLRSMPGLVFQPVWTCAVLLIFLSLWTSVFLALSTAEQDIKFNATTTRFQLHLPARQVIENRNGSVTFSQYAEVYSLESVKHALHPIAKFLLYFLVVMLFWSTEFIMGCQQMTVASSVASWYFMRDKSSLECPIGKSINRTVKYHLGSIALGSFLIVLFKIPRICLAFLEYYLKRFKDRYSCVNCTFKCCHCFLYCLENFIKYINHNAYTIIAIEGTSFCFSAKVAFQTIASNSLRIVTINSMGDFIIFLGKTTVTGSAAIFGIYYMRNDPGLHYLAVPVFFAALLSYFVAHSMLSVYEMVIDTMFLCFVEDVNKNANSSDGFFAPEGLLKFAIEDSKEIRTGVPTIAQEVNITRQPRNGSNSDQPMPPKAGFVYPLIESSH